MAIEILLEIPPAAVHMARNASDPDSITRFIDVALSGLALQGAIDSPLERETALCLATAVGLAVGRALRREKYAVSLLG